MKLEGAIGYKPSIKKISFKNKGKMDVHLSDGRTVLVPLSLFPSIKKLTLAERMKWQVLDNTIFTFNKCNEVFHLEQVLGKEKEYEFSSQDEG